MMRWRSRERPATRRLCRRLVFESLEQRRVLADLGIGVTLKDAVASPGATEIQIGIVGAEFELEIRVRDLRTTEAPQGIVALPLHVSWDPDFFQLAGDPIDPNLATEPVRVTADFPLLRSLDAFVPAAPACAQPPPPDFLECANLQGLRGASLPGLGQGAAIGAAGEEVLSTISLRAGRITEAANDARFTVQLAGSMSFADAAALENVVPGSNAVSTSEITVQTLLKVDPVFLTGAKFHDLDGDGVRTGGEPGLEGWTIRLIRDENGNGDPDAGEPEVTAVTAADGSYLFPIESDGSYLVREVPQPGWTQTSPDPAPITPQGLDISGIDFGNRRQLSSLSGTVYADTNMNGVLDSGEAGLPNVAIQLLQTGASAVPARTAFTGPDGWYHFEDLPPGLYEITQSQPTGFVNASITLGNVFLPGQSEPCVACQGGTDGLNKFVSIDIQGGGHGVDYNFGENIVPSKRRFLVSADPFRETCRQLELNCVTLQGTAGDDVITVESDTDAVRVTLNMGPVQLFFRDEVDIVKVDPGAGEDSVTLVGSSDVDTSHLTADACTLQSGVFRAGGYAVLAVSAERATVDGRSGLDRAVFRDSIGDDVLRGFVGPIRNLELALSANRSRVAVDFDQVRAISVPRAGATDSDTADLSGVPAELVGKWVLFP